MFVIIFLSFFAHETMSPKLHGAKVSLLQNSARLRLRGSKLRAAQVEGSKTLRAKVEGSKTLQGKFSFNLSPWSFGPLNVGLAKFWIPQPLPHGVLEQYNLSPRSFGYIVLGPK